MPETRKIHPAWRIAGLTFCTLMLIVHCFGVMQVDPFPDAWRDLYWASAIAHGERFPLSGPAIYKLFELGPWWFYLLALPLLFSGKLIVAAAFAQFLAGLKYFLAWYIGNRLADARLGLAFAGSLAIAGWSVIPLIFAAHPAVVETAVLLLVLMLMRCWNRFSTGNAVLLGPAGVACLHAHPSTALYVGGAFLALLIRFRSARALMLLALAAAVCIASILPPWFDTSPAIADYRPVTNYFSQDLGIDLAQRAPRLVWGILVNGFWDGYVLMTRWSLTNIRLGWLFYGFCLLFAATGVIFLRDQSKHLRLLAMAAVLIFITDAVVLVCLRPVTPMWMVSALLPPLAFAFAVGWFGWFQSSIAWRTRTALGLFALFVGLSVLPFTAYLKPQTHIRYMADANPLWNAIETSSNLTRMQVPLPGSYLRLDRIAGSLCEDAVLHGRLAIMIEQSFALSERNTCGRWPDLRYGGRAGPARHIAGIPIQAADVSGIAPDRVAEGLAFYMRVTAIAPAEGGHLAHMLRRQTPPDSLPGPAKSVVIEFDAVGSDVPVLTNRFKWDTPLRIDSVTVEGRPTQTLFEDGSTTLYHCSMCNATAPVHWKFDLSGVEENLDLVVLKASAN